MKTDESEKHPIFRWGIAKKFILYILLFSSVITLILTVIQLYMDYRYGLDSIEKSISQVEVSYLDGIITSLWVSDPELLQIQLEGMLKLSDMQYIDVVHNNETLARVGEFQDKHVITKNFPLSYTYGNKTISLGTLRIVYTLKDLYDRLMRKAIVIIISQGIKTFMVSGFIFFIFYLLVARHLHALANYASSLALKSLERPFVLKRNQNNRRKDEFDMLAKAINEMRINLNDSYHQLQGEIRERKRSEESLRESEARFTSVYDQSPIGIELYDSKGNLIDVNPKCLKIFGIRDVAAVRGFNLFEDPNISGEVKKRILAGEAVSYESEFDFDKVRELKLYETSNTGKMVVEVFVTPWKTGDSDEDKFLIHVMNTTARKQIEKELEKHREHLEELVEKRTEELKEKTDKTEESRKALTYLVEDVNNAREDLEKANRDIRAVNKELQDFAYIVSHDLKAPLRAVSQLAYWISEDYAEVLDEEGKEHLNLLSGRVKRMDGLINGILEYSRLGRAREKQDKIDLAKTLPGVIETLAPPENIRITIEDELPEIVGNKTHMEQVFQNLIGNAIKFMDKPEGLITIGCRDEGSRWEFRITDNGPGIHEKYHERIFKIFQTLVPRDEHESTGIGLTLVKKTIEQYDGMVWVESEVGKGSSFIFTLPKIRGKA